MAYDAVVVGAGINGLAAAVHLASKGWTVAVLERNALPGGAVRTAEVTLPGFQHDLYATNLGQFVGSPFFARHQTLLREHGLALVTADHAFATAFEDGSWLGVERNAEATARRIGVESPDDERRWRELATAFPDEAPHLFALLGAPMPSWHAARVLWRAWRRKGTGFLADSARLLVSSSRDWLDSQFESPKLKAMMAVWSMHLDCAPDIAGGALFPYLESFADQANGLVLGQGGAQTVITAMTGAISAHNGTVITNAEARAVTVENGRATGVRLADGRHFAARRAVIANLHPRLLYGGLVDGGLEDRRAAQAARLRPGPGTMMIHLALSEQPDWSDPALKSFAYVHLAPSLDAMARAYAQSLEGLLPVEPVLVVGQPTAVDPTRAPDGRHVLWIMARTVPARIQGDASGTITHRDWESAKEPYAERAIDIVERYAPGLRAKILRRSVHSPVDIENDNPNLIDGDTNAGSYHLDQSFLFRPAFGLTRYATPVTSLYMVGASVWPGAGTGAGPGFLCAKVLAGP